MKILFWMFIGFDRHTTSEHLLSAIIEQLCQSGHDVHVIQKDTGGNLSSIPEQLRKYEITTDTVSYKAADKGNFIARYLTELNYIKDCKKFITPNYDAVFIQSTNVAGFAVKAVRNKLPKAIVTYNVQDIFPYNAYYSGSLKSKGLIFKTLASIQRYGYNHSNHVITISEDMKDTLVEDGVDPDKIEVIYNWSYQDEPYKNVDLTPVEHMFQKEYFNVVYAGNIGMMQNVDILVETAALMKNQNDVWFHIIGDGLYKEKLLKRAQILEIKNISFWPLQSPDLAPAIYSAADVNIIPLVKDIYKTALPSKTATCLACGKPIIFAIGKNSRFGKKTMYEAECFVAGADRPRDLVGSINKIHEGGDGSHTEEFFLKYCTKTKNSRKYAALITQMVSK